MANHWIDKKKKEEARLALQRWCNKKYYDEFDFVVYGVVAEFFKKHPEYSKFKERFKVNWNKVQINPIKPDATGIPEVTIKEDN